MRCVFLRADGLDQSVQAFRKKHDPQAHLVEPHVTLVFPFDAEESDDLLIAHVEKIARITEPFDATLAQPVEVEDALVYMPLENGESEVRALHDRLYSGLLAPHLAPDIPYVPHMTIGKGPRAFTAASNLEFRRDFGVSTVMLERISDSGQSIPIARFPLGQQ